MDKKPNDLNKIDVALDTLITVSQARKLVVWGKISTTGNRDGLVLIRQHRNAVAKKTHEGGNG